MEFRRNHHRREITAQEVQQPCFQQRCVQAHINFNERDDGFSKPILTCTDEHLARGRMRRDDRFHFQQINSYAIDFDLVVLTSENFDFIVLISSPEVASAVQRQAHYPGNEAVDERRHQAIAGQIAMRAVWRSDANFAGLTWRAQLPVFRQKVGHGAGNIEADSLHALRHFRHFRCFSRDALAMFSQGRFCWAVQVHDFALRKRTPPFPDQYAF